MRTTVIFGFAVFLSLIAATARGQTISGTAAYRERMTLPSAAVFEAVLEDASRADATAAQTRIASPGNPIPFTITYDPAKIVATHRYAVRARILVDGKLVFSTDTGTPVVTGGSPTKVMLTLRRISADQSPVASSGASTPLEGTYWKAIELTGKAGPAQDANREAHLIFHAAGRVSGSDGCNQMTGTFRRTGDGITFGQMAGTQMACVDLAGTEEPFRDALRRTSRLNITGGRLELFDTAGTRLAVFSAGNQPSVPTPPPGLAGTSWQLVRFQGGDDAVLTPDDRAKYTIEFARDSRLTARVDCNRGHGTWKSTGSNQIAFGPLALTRAKCPPNSLPDQIVRQWGNIRSYVIKDGHLFLSLMADGGIYEFEPISK